MFGAVRDCLDSPRASIEASVSEESLVRTRSSGLGDSNGLLLRGPKERQIDPFGQGFRGELEERPRRVPITGGCADSRFAAEPLFAKLPSPGETAPMEVA